MLETKKIEYHDDAVLLEGYLAHDKAATHKKPAVMIVHDWSGRGEFANKKAEKIAELGYAGFAIDVFGKGKTGQTKEEKSELIKPFVTDRKILLKRLMSAFEVVKKFEMVDVTKIAIMGFCFGGLCALDLARSGTDLKGAVSFHGLLNKPENLPQKDIKAKILALHGFDDPMVPPDQVLAFEKEMTEAKADWQLHVYGNTMHAFTNPNANDPGFGTVYNSLAEKRSWLEMTSFFKEIF